MNVYRKTEKGHHEIETRSHRLTPRLRSALIVVDGRRTEDELGKLIVQAEEVLAALLEQGFIEVAATVEPRPPSRSSSASSTAAAAPRSSSAGSGFADTRREAVRALTDALGPMAEALAMRMEKAGSAKELRPLLEAAVQSLRNFRGHAAAAQFEARFLAENAES